MLGWAWKAAGKCTQNSSFRQSASRALYSRMNFFGATLDVIQRFLLDYLINRTHFSYQCLWLISSLFASQVRPPHTAALLYSCTDTCLLNLLATTQSLYFISPSSNPTAGNRRANSVTFRFNSPTFPPSAFAASSSTRRL